MRHEIYTVAWRSQADLEWFLFCTCSNLLNLLFKIEIKFHTTFYPKKLSNKVIWLINHFTDEIIHPINTSWKPTTFQAVWETRRMVVNKLGEFSWSLPPSVKKKAVNEIINMILLYVNKWNETKGWGKVATSYGVDTKEVIIWAGMKKKVMIKRRQPWGEKNRGRQWNHTLCVL